ncbi:MAG: hypothetical protein ACLGH3_07520 [Actinomycetota bacterium]
MRPSKIALATIGTLLAVGGALVTSAMADKPPRACFMTLNRDGAGPGSATPERQLEAAGYGPGRLIEESREPDLIRYRDPADDSRYEVVRTPLGWWLSEITRPVSCSDPMTPELQEIAG